MYRYNLKYTYVRRWLLDASLVNQLYHYDNFLNVTRSKICFQSLDAWKAKRRLKTQQSRERVVGLDLDNSRVGLREVESGTVPRSPANKSSISRDKFATLAARYSDADSDDIKGDARITMF